MMHFMPNSEWELSSTYTLSVGTTKKGQDYRQAAFALPPLHLSHSFASLTGAVASWLVRSTPDRVVWVRDLAGDIALCS